MKQIRKHWSKEKCQEEALKYKNRNMFKNSCMSAYNKARKNGWLDEICSHMVYINKPSGYWNNKLLCQNEAMKYNTRFEFQKNSRSAYGSAKRNNWLNEICSHMIEVKKPSDYWTKEKCHEEALKYKTRTEFYNNEPSAYKKAQENNFLDDICKHMIIVGDKYKRCIYSYEFSDNHVYVGLTYNTDDRHKRHISENNSIVNIHMSKTGFEPIMNQLTDYIDVEEAVNMEEYYVNYYKKNGWVILNRIKTGSIGSNKKHKWTYEKCKEEALKYNNKRDFTKYGKGAYSYAYKRGWKDDICSHMIELKKPNGYWTKERCENEYLKYNNIKQFKQLSKGAYDSAKRNKWLDSLNNLTT